MEALQGASLTSLVKKHFSAITPDTKEFQNILLCSLDEVAAEHEEFFKHVARSAAKLNKAELVSSLRNLMHGEASQISIFADKLVQTQRHCKNKSRQLTTGEKLAPATKRIAIIYKKHAGREESPPCSEMSSSPREEPSGPPYPRQASSGNLSSNSGDAQDELHKAKSMWGSFSPQKSTSGEIVCLESPVSVASSADPFEDHGAAQVGTPLLKHGQLE